MDILKIKGLKGKPAVLDNNIICDFIELGCIEILNKVFSKILIPESIYEDEIRQLDAQHLLKVEYELTSFSSAAAHCLFHKISNSTKRLSDYDIEVIVIAHEKAVLCTSNEKKIKEICEEYNIEHTGTVGILCCCFEQNILSEAEFSRLIITLFTECTCRLSPKLKEQIFKQYPFIGQ